MFRRLFARSRNSPAQPAARAPRSSRCCLCIFRQQRYRSILTTGRTPSRPPRNRATTSNPSARRKHTGAALRLLRISKTTLPCAVPNDDATYSARSPGALDRDDRGFARISRPRIPRRRFLLFRKQAKPAGACARRNLQCQRRSWPVRSPCRRRSTAPTMRRTVRGPGIWPRRADPGSLAHRWRRGTAWAQRPSDRIPLCSHGSVRPPHDVGSVRAIATRLAQSTIPHRIPEA